MTYRPEIDGLRALAVILVIFSHAGYSVLSGGFVGVDIFFVISGYLITSIIATEKEAGKFTIVGFYERRARRILPALFLVMLACLPFAWAWLLPSDMKGLCDSFIAVVAFASNILFWRTTGYFDPDTELKPLLHTWSLAVEEQFYLGFPLLLMLLWRLGRRWITATLGAIALVSLGLAHWGSAARPDLTFYLLPTRAWELMIGAIVALHPSSGIASGTTRPVREAGACLGIALIAYSVLVYNERTPFPSLYALVPTLGTALIILCATPVTRVGRWLASPALVGIGLISYSAYLWHQPLFAFARYTGSRDKPLMAVLALAAFALAYLSWRHVERPFRDRQRFSRKQIFGLSVAGALAFIAIGAAGSLSHGFAWRYGEADRPLATMTKIDSGRYVAKRFDELLMKPFDAADARRKLLVIGDSHAQDMVNALYEGVNGGLAARLQITTRVVAALCGNLFVAPSEFHQHIEVNDRRGCSARGHVLFEDAALRDLMRAADEIWFVSFWRDWQTSYIPKSVANTREFANKPVRVFGRKDLGVVSIRLLLAIPSSIRLRETRSPSAASVKINAALRESLQPGVFVDTQRLLCGSNEQACPLFAGGELISYDGSHLTPAGARFLGAKLATAGLFD